MEAFAKTKESIGHSGQIFSIDFYGDFIYSSSADKYVTRWDIETGKQDKFAIRFEKSPYSLALISNNEKLAVGLENGDLHIFDLHVKKEIKFCSSFTSEKYYFYYFRCLAFCNKTKINPQFLLPRFSKKLSKMVKRQDYKRGGKVCASI